MTRSAEKDEATRRARQAQILDAALSVYVRMGFYGTDMDFVAAEAGLAKGLLYYYYKSKQQLFCALFEWVTEQTASDYQGFLTNAPSESAIDQLASFTWSIFGSAVIDPRHIQFAMRMPFDARAVFGDEAWSAGKQHSTLFMGMLTEIIARGMDQGDIPRADPALMANAFWAVFVANLFHFTSMIHNEGATKSPCVHYDDVVRFCFQGLGIEAETWHRSVRACTTAKGSAHP